MSTESCHYIHFIDRKIFPGQGLNPAFKFQGGNSFLDHIVTQYNAHSSHKDVQEKIKSIWFLVFLGPTKVGYLFKADQLKPGFVSLIEKPLVEIYRSTDGIEFPVCRGIRNRNFLCTKSVRSCFVSFRKLGELKCRKDCCNIHLEESMRTIISGILRRSSLPVYEKIKLTFKGQEFVVTTPFIVKGGKTLEICSQYFTENGCVNEAECPFYHVDKKNMKVLERRKNDMCCNDVKQNPSHIWKEWDCELQEKGLLRVIGRAFSQTQCLPPSISLDDFIVVRIKDLCRASLEGRCKWGEACKNFHVCPRLVAKYMCRRTESALSLTVRSDFANREDLQGRRVPKIRQLDLPPAYLRTPPQGTHLVSSSRKRGFAKRENLQGRRISEMRRLNSPPAYPGTPSQRAHLFFSKQKGRQGEQNSFQAFCIPIECALDVLKSG